MMPLHPAGRPLHAYLAEDTEKALLMDKLDSSVFEHIAHG